MTDQLKRQLQASLVTKDYFFIYKTFVDNGLSFKDLLVFYKINDEIVLPDSEFWNSQLAHYYLEQVIESELKISFVESYFESDANCNEELNKHLIIICKEDFIRYFKLWRAFEKPRFWSSFKVVSETDPDFARVKRELEVVRALQTRIQSEVSKDERCFLQFTLGDLLLGYTLYYYEFKHQPEILGNKSRQTQIEAAVLTELNNVFLLHRGKPNMQFGFKDNSELQSYFGKNEALHHILSKPNPRASTDIKFKWIYNLLERALSRTELKNSIQLYLCGFADFEAISYNKGQLRTNGKFRLFQINNAKSSPEEYYFSNYRVETMSRPKKSLHC